MFLLTAGVAIGATAVASLRPTFAYADASSYTGSIEEPDSHLRFPVFVQANQEWQRLIGLGVRRVVFINVYVVGIYMKSEDIGTVLRDASWKNFSKDRFLNNESLALSLLVLPVDVSVRIVPCRNSSGQHLRDGFTRTLVQRMKAQAHHLTEEDEARILEGIREFKEKFVNAKVKKDSEFIFTKTKDGKLRMEFEGKNIGTVNNEWVAINFLMTYLNPTSPASVPALESIANGFDRMMNSEPESLVY
ncbi:chalcone isomerase [Hesseltinella vesiculosa]|uniref:Chalcone isomerase n=1 Tax=Hesseltinella vesiculosa TaxID=101127 RepID=A0A1X2G7A1_9FUNG|nr:chalcone isomerase [Hesseltinella vesiculosa]